MQFPDDDIFLANIPYGATQLGRAISEIKKQIVEKEKMLEKSEKEKPGIEKEVKKLAAEVCELDDQIKKTKDKKAKGELEDERDEVAKKYEPVKKKLLLIEEALDSIPGLIEALEQELEDAEEGVEKYRLARQAGKDHLIDVRKDVLKGVAKVKQKLADTEQACKDAESYAKQGKENEAQGARNNANNAAFATYEAEQEVNKLYEAVKSYMTSNQRNLKAADFDVADIDVRVHNDLTKEVQDLFKEIELAAGECKELVDDAKQIAEDAAEFANATSVDSDTYEKMLGKTLATAQEKIKEVMRETESKWGGYIMKKGELFTRLADQYLQERNTQNRTLIEKAFEQGQTYLDSTKASIDRQIKAVVDFVNKTTRRVPQEYQRSLKPQVDKLRMAAITILNFQKKFDQNYDATQVEFKRMAGLID